MGIDTIIGEAFAQPKDAITHRLSELLAKHFQEKFCLETEEQHFKLSHFAHDGKCTVSARPDVHSQWQYGWAQSYGRLWREPYNAWLTVEWEGKSYEVVTIGWLGAHCRQERSYILGSNAEEVKSFFTAVCTWHAEVRGEVLVYDDGHWQKDADLFSDIQSSTFDALVLEGDLKKEIIDDLTSFFRSRDHYERYGIAWKRGVLLLGPPGNGKTHAVKAAVNLLGVPCLYAKSFTASYQTEHHCVKEVFRRAREAAPCVLVFEDLDSLLTDENRAFFLNEMDGFASNAGILTVATTNHPERLDPAILDRPSRFDRKYTFDLPGLGERTEYLRLFSGRLDPELQVDGDALQRVAEATEGYSYAYLKELYISSMLKWIGAEGKASIAELMTEQSDRLKDMMASEPEMPRTSGMEPPHMKAYRRMMARRG